MSRRLLEMFPSPFCRNIPHEYEGEAATSASSSRCWQGCSAPSRCTKGCAITPSIPQSQHRRCEQPGRSAASGGSAHTPRDSTRQLSQAPCRLLFPEQLPLRERIPKDTPRLSVLRRADGPAARKELPVLLCSQPGPPHIPCMGLLPGPERWERCVTFPLPAGTQPAGAGFAPAAARLCLEVLFNFFKVSAAELANPALLLLSSRRSKRTAFRMDFFTVCFPSEQNYFLFPTSLENKPSCPPICKGRAEVKQ